MPKARTPSRRRRAAGVLATVLVAMTAVPLSAGSASAETAGLPRLSINDRVVVEGDTGQTTVLFTIRLSKLVSTTTIVTWSTVPGTATSADFMAASGTVVIPAGERTKAAAVTVYGDVRRERDETFSVVLSNPTNATLKDPEGVATILDDDQPARRG